MLNNQKIALIINSDDHYIDLGYTQATIKSFLFHNKWFNGDIIFFDDKEFFTISEENKMFLQTIYHKIVFKYLDYSKYKNILQSFTKLNINNQRLFKAYPKFEIFNLLNEYDKILCIDADIIFVNNIKELFYSNYAIGVTSSYLKNYYKEKHILSKKLKKNDALIYFDSGGFNSGVIYLGNKLLCNITNELINYMQNIIDNYNTSNKIIEFFDQCIFNYFFNKYYNDKLTIINPIYNVVIDDGGEYKLFENVSSDYILYLYKNAKIFHYIYKPLLFKVNNQTDNYFYKLWEFYKDLNIDLIDNQLEVHKIKIL